jgi:hypothetical protein
VRETGRISRMVGKGLTLEFISVRFEENIEGEVSRRSFIALHLMKGKAVARQLLGSCSAVARQLLSSCSAVEHTSVETNGRGKASTFELRQATGSYLFLLLQQG